ncbi:MAG: class I SAM-dependent methyltransferase [Alphaproteobacteria bacterium]|nr:class I SAM-dependent methyltransferase [Alphaproteobacteria bacterium]
MSSITYYNKNAQIYSKRTVNGCRLEFRERFLAQLKPGVRILDVGCGVGREARFFEELGYDVTAVDGSEEMIKLASQILKKPPLFMRFQDMNFSEEFDGIWAAASLIHVPSHELKDIISRIWKALKPEGIFFANFKHGEGEYTQEERTFYYITETSLRPYLADQFKIIDIWTAENRSSHFAHSPDKLWLNVLGRKISRKSLQEHF